MKNLKDQLLTRRSRIGKRTSLMGGIAAISMAVIVGTVAVVSSFASNEQLYLTPATGTVLAGNTIAVQIRVNSGTDTVNAVQANLSYNPAQLAFQSVDPSGTAFGLEASTITTSGVVQLARATSGGTPAVTGDNLFATVTFKALVGTGSAQIKIDTGSHVVRSTDAVDILATSAGSMLTLATAGGGTPTPSPTPLPGTVTPTPAVSPTPAPSTSPGVYTGKLMLSPATVSIAPNANVTFDVQEDSGSAQVNAIQANLTYDPAKLQYVGVDATGSDFPLNAVTATGSGALKLTRALNGGDPAVTGLKQVAKVTFKVLATSGTIAVAYDTGSVISTIDGMNALIVATGSTVTVAGGTSPTPTPSTATPTPTPGTGGGTTPTPRVSPAATSDPTPQPTDAPVSGGTVSTPAPFSPAPTPAPVVTIPVVGAKGAIKVTGTTRLTAPSIPSNAQIAYAIDDKTSTPVIDTTALDNGSHIVTATAVDPATGNSQVVKQKINVENTQPLWKTLVQGAKSSWPYLLIILAVIALAVGLWLFMRRLAQAPEAAPLYADGLRDTTTSNLIHPTESSDKSGPTGPLGF